MGKSKILILGSTAYVQQIEDKGLPLIYIYNINLPYVAEATWGS